MHRFARVTHAVKSAILHARGLPASQAANVNLSITRVATAAHEAAVKSQRELHHAALPLPFDLLSHDVEERAFAVRHEQEVILKRPPAFTGYPNLSTTGVIHALR